MGAICGLGYFTENMGLNKQWKKLTADDCNHSKGAYFGNAKISLDDNFIGFIVQYRCDWFLGCKVRFRVFIGDTEYDLGEYGVSGTKWVATKLVDAPKKSVSCKLEAYENNSLVDYVSFTIDVPKPVTYPTNPTKPGSGYSPNYPSGGGEYYKYFEESNANMLLYLIAGVAIAGLLFRGGKSSKG